MTKKSSYFFDFVYYYLPVLLWMGLIFYLSSISGLKSGTSSIPLEIFLRKSAHIFEYLIFSFLVWRVFYFKFGLSLFRANVATMIFCFLYASSDEIHQFFVPDRSGQVVDVFVDMVGIFGGVIVGNSLARINLKK